MRVQRGDGCVMWFWHVEYSRGDSGYAHSTECLFSGDWLGSRWAVYIEGCIFNLKNTPFGIIWTSPFVLTWLPFLIQGCAPLISVKKHNLFVYVKECKSHFLPFFPLSLPVSDIYWVSIMCQVLGIHDQKQTQALAVLTELTGRRYLSVAR